MIPILNMYEDHISEQNSNITICHMQRFGSISPNSGGRKDDDDSRRYIYTHTFYGAYALRRER